MSDQNPSDGNGDGGVATMTKKDFTSDQEVRWCPGCGDYAILAAMQSFMPELGIEREQTVANLLCKNRRGHGWTFSKRGHRVF